MRAFRIIRSGGVTGGSDTAGQPLRPALYPGSCTTVPSNDEGRGRPRPPHHRE